MKHSSSLIVFGFLLGITSTSLSASVLGSNVFSDVGSGTYYDSAIGDMYSAGIITGYADGRFGPNDYVTRGQVAVIMQRFRNDLLGIETPQPQSSSYQSLESSSSTSSESSFVESSSSLPTATGEAGSIRFTTGSFTVNEDEGTATISLIREGGTEGSVTIKYAISEGTADSGFDFDVAQGTIEFGNGQSNKSFTVTINDDTTAEEDETVILTLKNPSGGVGLSSPATATLTITDDDGGSGTQSTSVNGTLNYSAMEYRVPDDGSIIIITVVRSQGDTGVVSVQYTTSNNTANGNHYNAEEGTLQFADGETKKTFEVSVANDTSINGNKKFDVRLHTPTGGAVLGDLSDSTVVIVDDEVSTFAEGSLRFTDESYTGSEFQQQAILVVERVGGANGDATIDYTTNSGSAQKDVDYTHTEGTLEFRNGETMKRIIVPILRDTKSDANEFFTVKISNPTGGVGVLSPTSASVTIP